ncbi:hypothetical protein POTOM_060549 [Populus tomentosa]|uniref:Uncharacterized protein n=1 Tax=Populus tomentosa TaxID=118781 RepID=A0A8X8C0B5_POPTO|nr:hypothetical protein POTOM_060549 [Populus tomentosa]
MPLCICEAPTAKTDPVPMQTKPSSTFHPSRIQNQRKQMLLRRIEVLLQAASLGAKVNNHDWSLIGGQRGTMIKEKLMFGFQSWPNDKWWCLINLRWIMMSMERYNPLKIGLREAIKNGDTVAVKKLLSEGVDANYHDKQGMSLLHLDGLGVGCTVNRTDIAFILMDSGASMNYKNAQGETPLDCAPATLQYKMKQKMEESGQQGPHTSL